MKTYPDINDDFRLPTVGDRVFIGPHQITFDVPPSKIPYEVRVAPNFIALDSSNKQSKSIRGVLRKTLRDTKHFLELNLSDSVGIEEKELLSAELKTLFENYRALLEYSAHYIAMLCNPIPKEKSVQFPITSLTESEETFKKRLNKSFPNLQNTAPEILDLLLSIQEFDNTEGRWLMNLASITNQTKHRHLMDLQIGEFASVIFHNESVGFRLGELGFEIVSVEEGGEFVFPKSDGSTSLLKGPFRISATEIGNLDSTEIVTEIQYLRLLKMDSQIQSVPHNLWLTQANVLRTVDKICYLVQMNEKFKMQR